MPQPSLCGFRIEQYILVNTDITNWEICEMLHIVERFDPLLPYLLLKARFPRSVICRYGRRFQTG